MLQRRDALGEGQALALCIGGAFAALVLLPSTRLFDPKAVAALGLAALGCLGLALPGPEGRRLPSVSLLSVWALVVLAWILSRLASPYGALVDGLDEAGLAGVCACLCLACGPEAWGRSLLRFWRWATLILAAYALAQRLGLEPLAGYALAGSRARAMGSFGNAGYLAAFLCLSWPLFLAWRPRQRAAALLLLFAALAATQSRAGLLATAAQAAILVAAAWRAARRRAASPETSPAGNRPTGLLVLISALAVVLALGLFPSSQWLRPTLRGPLWMAAVRLWLQRPGLGWGPGSFALAFQEHAPAAWVSLVNAGNQYAEDPHQVLLAVACAGGLLGLLALAGSAAFLLRLVQGSPLPEASALGLGILGLFLESQADRFFFQVGVFVPLCAMVGLLARRPELPAPVGASSRAGSLVARFAASEWLNLGCLALSLALVWRGAVSVLRYRQGVGVSMDAGVGVLASAGDPRALAAQVRASGSGGPQDPLVLERLGDALAAQRRYGEAAQALEKALALQPTRGRAQNLGDCRMMLGDYAGAETAFERAVALEPGNADAHFSLGYALFYQKKLKAALAELDTALRLDPSHAGARQLRRQILQ